MSPARSWYFIPTLFRSPHHQLSMAVKEQVHKIYVQLFFSKTRFKVILQQKGAKGLRAPSPLLIRAGARSARVSALRNVWDNSDTLWPAR